MQGVASEMRFPGDRISPWLMLVQLTRVPTASEDLCSAHSRLAEWKQVLPQSNLQTRHGSSHTWITAWERLRRRPSGQQQVSRSP